MQQPSINFLRKRKKAFLPRDEFEWLYLAVIAWATIDAIQNILRMG